MCPGLQGLGFGTYCLGHIFACKGKKEVKERIVLREIHLRTTGRHLSMGSHSITCHPTEVTARITALQLEHLSYCQQCVPYETTN